MSDLSAFEKMNFSDEKKPFECKGILLDALNLR